MIYVYLLLSPDLFIFSQNSADFGRDFHIFPELDKKSLYFSVKALYRLIYIDMISDPTSEQYGDDTAGEADDIAFFESDAAAVNYITYHRTNVKHHDDVIRRAAEEQ